MPMPIGSPIYFESPGNPDEYKNNFGFFFVTIIAPNLYAPILQTRTLNKKRDTNRIFNLSYRYLKWMVFFRRA
jgi:hypothetical protein